MKKVFPVTLLLIAILGVSTGILVPVAARANPPTGDPNLTPEPSNQESVAVTVYNSDIGLVRDIRQLRLPLGRTELRFTDVAAKIMPQTVHIKSISPANHLQVLEQNYEYDLLTPRKLLDKFVGKEIRVLKDGAEVPITILSTNEGIVYKLGNRIFTGQPHNLIFPDIPENLISQPTLVWSLENPTASAQTVEATYLTRGLNWRADYVAVLDSNDEHLDLSGWVTLDNQSGASYSNARLKLVAGDLNRVIEEQKSLDTVAGRMGLADKVASSAPFAEQSFFEYHLYSLQRPTTIKNQQTKQVSLLSAERIPVNKRFIFRGSPQYFHSRYTAPFARQKVGVYVEIANKKDHNLGMPLPKGTLRVYKADAEGSRQFIGEDRIDHTPKDESIKIKMGDAFDVVAQRTQTDWRKIADNLYEAAFEISLRNHKNERVTVSVLEPMMRDWEILNSSHPHKKPEAFTAQFEIPVARDGEAKLTYRARYKF